MVGSSCPTTSVVAIDLKAAVTSFSVGSTPRACVTGHWEKSPSMMLRLSLSDFALRRAPKDRAHLPGISPPGISPGYRSIIPSSSRMYY